MEFHGILHGRDSRKTSSKKRPLQKIYKRKDARNGFRVHVQRGQEATAPVYSRGKRSRRKGSTASVPAQERWMQYPGHLQNHGTTILHDARLAVAHTGRRAPPQARQEARPTKIKMPAKVFKAVRHRVRKEPKDFGFESGSWQMNLLLEMIRERFGLEWTLHFW